ncbi:PKD repeat protein/glucose/arabinose dehydrogenase/type 1 glutamine amidotransferase [Micromonospora profundi]|uniref:ThuA domain-containing protein n=1 Tax=Micromonospora profundi TaxID=1420889 RepID=UPI00143B9725|nr:ThuA domain-containing protein [Micromonospora profundi]NJC16218.1 PKD repeat protein/glucose/arabinose dehydrogenase/type 1 glutamine amidotransferase [Micromonospora profundi]
MSRSRRARVPLTATLLSLALVSTTLFSLPAQAAKAPAQVPPNDAQAVTPVSQVVPKAPKAAAADPFSVLVFSKTAGFRHDSIPTGVAAIQQLGATNGFTVDTTEDGAAFNDANLAKYKAVIWLSTTGDVLNAEQQAAFERYVQAGGGYVGIHAASDTEYSWAWYGDLVGAYFANHPANQQATVKVEDHAHPSTAELPDRWSRFDEWYNFQTNPRPDVHVLASLDEKSYNPGAGAMGADHPTAWCQDFDGGRSWYTGGGHTRESFAEPEFLSHLLGGIQTAAGVVDADCGASKTSNFEKITLDSNTSNPMELDIAPDGRVFYIERDGRVQIIKPDTGNTVTAIDLDVFTGNEDGLIGIRLDPDFATNNWVYLYYAPNDNVTRNLLSRFTVTGDTINPASEKQVLRVDTQRNTCCHAGGSMTFDGDGNLYLATGDNTNPFESSAYTPIDERPGRQDYDAQRTSGNTNDLRGKVIRIHPEDDGTYTIPAGNLFAPGTEKTRPEIYAMGFRNPFRIGTDPKTNTLYVADYGPDANADNPNRGPRGLVEWNVVTPGNYGWPYCTGTNEAYNDYTFPSGPSGAKFDCAAPVNNSPNNTGLTNLPPVVPATVDYGYAGDSRYPEIGGGGAPMGGPVYRYDADLNSTRKWPAYYDGKALLGEWNQNKMYTMQMSADGKSLVDINQLLTGMSMIRPMDFEFGPDGALYLIEWGSGFGGNNDNSGVYRIDYTAGDRAPIAAASATPTSGPAPLTVTFSSAGSRDPDGGTLTYAWAFGDGQTSTEANPTHTYATAGDYTAQLTVTNPKGRTAVANVPVTVGNTAPTVTIEFPPDGGFFDWGDQVRYTIKVTDPEDGQIDCDEVQLQVLLGHDEHAHPLEQHTGCTGTVQTSLASGHGAEANVFAVFEATYTDKGGNGGSGALTGRAIEILQPKRKQAEYFTATGRAPVSTGGGDAGVQRETGSDTAGGGQNIGFIEDGDWWSVAPADLTNISEIRFRAASAAAGGRIEVRAGAVDGPVVATATVPATGAWQTYTDVSAPVTGAASGSLFFLARDPNGGTGSLFNVNWMDFVGRGVTENAPPVVTATATPATGTAPVTVAFDGTATDAEGDTPLTYAWDFGDGGSASTLDASHTYTSPGTFTATLTVTDSKGAKSYATVPVRVDAPDTSCFGARSDDFNGTSLDKDRWTVVRENQLYSVSGGALRLPTGVGDLYGARNDATNLVLQAAPTGAWEMTTKVTLPVTANYQQAGLLVYGDDDNYAKVDLLYNGSRRVEFIRETAGTPRNESADSAAAPAGDTVYLRITSDGTNLTAAASADGQTFTQVGRSADLAGITNPRIGVFALNGGTEAPVVDAAFDSFQVTPDAPAGPVDPSDEFTGSTLDKCRWDAILREDPAGYRVTGGALRIDVPNGDIYGTDNTGPKNFILQTAPSGDWTLETKVDGSLLNEQYQQAGLIVQADDDNYLKFDFIADNQAGQAVTRRIEFRSEIGGTVQNPQPEAGNLTDAVWHLRLARSGDTFTASYSADGTTWTALESLTNSAVGATPKVGLFTLGANQTASKTASFDYFRLSTRAVDETAPVTTAAVSGTPTEGWYTGPVTVTLTAADEAGGSGLAGTSYQLDGATAWTPYTEPVTVSGDGEHELRFRSTDQAGNVESTKTVAVKIDATAPVTSATFAPANDEGWHNGTIPVVLTSTDAGSGVKSVEWSLDGGAWTPYSEPIEVTGDGQHELLFRSTDKAGNAETLKSAVLRIDGTKPTLLVSGIADGQLYGDSQDVRVSWQAVDPTSGIASVVGTLDGKAYASGTLQAMYELPLGLHELTVTATDKAGNKTTSAVRFFVTTSFRDMQNLLDRFKATGRLSAKAHKDLTKKLDAVRKAEAAGNDNKALKELDAFRKLAADTKLVTEAEIRDVLVRDADAMTVRLGGTPASNAGVKANKGKPVKGAGRLGDDVTRLAPGRQL